MAQIYVVEDDKNIREIESYALKNSGHMVSEFVCAKDFYKKISEKVPDLILLDIMLPDEDGLEIVKKLRMSMDTRRIPIIMVSAKSAEIDKVKGFDLGADDYLTKPFGVMELVSRVKALLRRSSSDEEEKALSFGDVVIDGQRRKVFIADQPCELTFKEYELLKLLIKNAGIVISRDIIMDKVWGCNFEGESRTLDMLIKTLRQKMKQSEVKIKTVRNVGYMIE